MVVGASLGEMLVPLLVANLFVTPGPISLMIVLLACAIAGFMVWLIINAVGRRTKKRTEPEQHPEAVSSPPMETNLLPKVQLEE